MRAIDGTRLKEYLTCPRLPWLAFHRPREVELPPTAAMEVLFRSGYRVEERILAPFRAQRVEFEPGDFDGGFRATLRAMDEGAPAIVNGVLKLGEFLGRPDLLLWNEGERRYEVADVKSSQKVHASARMQVAFYSRLLGQVRMEPRTGHVIVRDGTRHSFPLAELEASVQHLLATMQRFRVEPSSDPGPRRMESCGDCRYRELCLDELEARDDVGLLPGVSRAQLQSLRAAGVATTEALAAAGDLRALAAECELGVELLQRLRMVARALREGRALPLAPPRAELFEARFALAAVFEERQTRPAVAVAGQVLGDPEKFRMRWLRAPESDAPQREFRELCENLLRSTGPILVHGSTVARLLHECAHEDPGGAALVARLLPRFMDLRAELRRTFAVPDLDRTPLQAARALGLAERGEDEVGLDLLRYLEEEEGAEAAAVERHLRRELLLIERLRDRLRAREAAA